LTRVNIISGARTVKAPAVALAVAVTVSLALGGTAVAAISQPVQDQRQVAAASPGPPLVVLAGGPSWLVFEQRDPEQSSVDAPKVMVRSQRGHVTTLPHSAGEWSWQVSGDMVVARKHPFVNSELDWWDMATGKHGIVRFGESQKLPGKRTVLGATPDGVAYLSRDHRVHETHVESAKHRQSSFKGVDHKVSYAFTTPQGIVYETDHGRDWYQKLSGRHEINRIQVPNSVAAHSACYSANRDYLGCWHGYDADDVNTADSVELIPLDGSTPTISTDCPGEPTLAGDTLVWATSNTYNGHEGCTDTPPTVNLLSSGQTDAQHSGVAVTGPTPRTYNAATAYGLAIFTGTDHDTIVGVDDTGNSQILYTS
jgi:hypothetical protein